MPEETPSDKWAKGQVMVLLAGSLAERRALQGSEPGWRRDLSREQVTCFHESAHAVVATAVGQHVYELNVAPGLKTETGAPINGYCSHGVKAQRPAGPDSSMLSDKRMAANLCLLLAGDPRGAVRCLRILRVATRDVIESRWQYVGWLAWELSRYGRLDQAQISHILEGLPSVGPPS